MYQEDRLVVLLKLQDKNILSGTLGIVKKKINQLQMKKFLLDMEID